MRFTGELEMKVIALRGTREVPDGRSYKKGLRPHIMLGDTDWV